MGPLNLPTGRRPVAYPHHFVYRTGRAIWLFGLLTLLGFVSLFPLADAQMHPQVVAEPGQVLQTTVHPFAEPGPKVQVERLPLLELFTATWCPPCAPADRAVDRLLEERSPGLPGGANDTGIGLAVLAYHPWPDQGAEDPFGIPEGNSRMVNKYDAFWFPSTYVDGFLEDAPTTRSTQVDAGMEEVLYQSYHGLLRRAEAIPPGFTMTTQWNQTGDEVTVRLDLEATATVEGPFYVRGALWEDHLHFGGSNGIDDHRMTVRAMTGQQVLLRLEPGQVWSETFTVRLPEGVQPARSGVTFIVETAWDDERHDAAGTLMAFAGGSAVVAATAVFMLRRRPSPRGGQRADSDHARPTEAAGDPDLPTRPDPEGRP